jgi:TonB family protein
MIITGLIVALLLVIGLIWSGRFSLVTPPGVEEYDVVGAVDFGDNQMGSRDVNTKEEAVPDPTPDPAPAKPAPAAETQPSPSPSKPKADPVVTQPDPSPVTTPKPDPKPTNTKPTTTTTKPTETKPPTKPDDGKEEEKVEAKPSDNTTAKPGGSNQGDANTGTGNAGVPDAPIDDRFKFSFNPGGGGSGGFRRPVSLPYPVYNTQEEAKMKFEFVIGPDGRVKTVKLLGGLTDKLNLKRAGIDAIRKWRFEPKPSNQPQTNQTAQVEITFKLK